MSFPSGKHSPGEVILRTTGSMLSSSAHLGEQPSSMGIWACSIGPRVSDWRPWYNL